MTNDTRTIRGSRGFTLIELLVVLAVVLLIAGLLLAGLARTVGNARASTAQRAVESLVAAVDQFKAEFGFLPPLVHDGQVMAGSGYIPTMAFDPSISVASEPDWPVVRFRPPGGSRQIKQLAVWSESESSLASPPSHLRYLNFIRRRSGQGADAIRLPSGSAWDISTAWEDRRYSKFSLPYYLSGIGSRDVDGVDGPGMTRPLSSGLFEGVIFQTLPSGTYIATVRDRFDPVIDASRGALRLVTGYQHEDDYAEHNAAMPDRNTVPDSHAAFVDPWGRAYRYYRWEPGRVVGGAGGRLVVQNSLDLNIPPVLINPELYAEVRNADGSNAARDIDLTSPTRGGGQGNVELRSARYAIVSAGPDGLFGTEPIALIAQRLRQPVPTSDADIARLRKLAWEDNIVGLGN